jgi:hypothetical protein
MYIRSPISRWKLGRGRRAALGEFYSAHVCAYAKATALATHKSGRETKTKRNKPEKQGYLLRRGRRRRWRQRRRRRSRGRWRHAGGGKRMGRRHVWCMRLQRASLLSGVDLLLLLLLLLLLCMRRRRRRRLLQLLRVRLLRVHRHAA